MSNQRAILLLVNAAREEAKGAAEIISKILISAEFKIYAPADTDVPNVEVVLVLGGDGTILRGAEFSLKQNIPLLGIN
jgi:NAD+ kinase